MVEDKEVGIFSVFTGGITNTHPSSKVNLPQTIEAIKSDRYREAVTMIRGAATKSERDMLKKRLIGDYVTFGGVFSYRNKESLLTPSGLMCIDIDELKLEEVKDIKDKICQDEHTRACFISPSGLGLKVIVAIPQNEKRYSGYFLAYAKKIGIEVDTPTRDISRACFMSWDAEAHLNMYSKIWVDYIDEKIEDPLFHDRDPSAPIDTSRSGKEFAEVSKMLELGKGKEEIWEYMSHTFVKWAQAPEQYRVRTYEQALKKFENKEWVKVRPKQAKELPEEKEETEERLIKKREKTDYKDNPEVKLILSHFEGTSVVNKKTGVRKEVPAPSEEVKEGINELAKFLLNTERVLFDPRNDAIKIYTTDNFYEACGEDIIRTKIEKILGKYNTRNVQAEVINKIKNLAPKTSELEEIPLNLLPFRNGILDINDMVLLPHDPGYFFQYQVPWNYNPDAECPRIDEFIEECVKKEEIPLIYDIVGLMIYRVNLFDKYFIFSGIGSNGKTLMIKLYERVIGENNRSAIPLKQLTEDRFAMASTYLKLLNVGADIGGELIRDASMLRSMCSKDSVAGQFKFGQIFNFVPSALMLFSANQAPKFAEDTDGNYRRIETINFPYSFGNARDRIEHPDWRMADPKKLEKISTESEIEGFIAKGVKCLISCIETGGLSLVRSTQELRNNYLLISDSLKSFMEENCIESEYNSSDRGKISGEWIEGTGFIPKTEFYTRYKTWCKQRKINAFSFQKVGRMIEFTDWGIQKGKDTLSKDGERDNTYRGIAWKTN